MKDFILDSKKAIAAGLGALAASLLAALQAEGDFNLKTVGLSAGLAFLVGVLTWFVKYRPAENPPEAPMSWAPPKEPLP